MSREDAASRVEPPYQLGESIGVGAWELINLDGRLAGYGFESEPLAPLPGFSGAPINLFVMITLEGKFIDVELIAQNEPIFVSGLGEAPFNEFLRQYKGHSITDPLAIGVPYGSSQGSGEQVYLKGVTKATASVRIAHESILGAAFAIAREKMSKIGPTKSARPDFEHQEDLNWEDLVSSGIASHKLVTNAEVDSAFKGTQWADDDAEAKADPQGAYLDMWIVDVGPPAIAKAVLTDESLRDLQHFMSISPNNEPILILENGRHGLVGENFVRNTSPDLISASMDGLPMQLRDADLVVELKNGVPGRVAMIFRVDRRLGYDPTREMEFSVTAERKHGSFRPEIGTVKFSIKHKTDERFFVIDQPPKPKPPWLQAVEERMLALGVLGASLLVLFGVMIARMNWLAGLKQFATLRLAILAFVLGFIGWWGQGQLSIATVLGVVRSLAEGKSLAFLAYDPFSLLIWAVTFISFVLWGRGFFCGWLCPFGALQEFSSWLGSRLGIKQITVPDRWDRGLSFVKYGVLASMLVAALVYPTANDFLIEVEPFKTAITTQFFREWYFIAYAVGLLIASMFVFKGFCRYLCPLGAFMAIGGMLRIPGWIERRAECGSPCQLCKVKCRYGAIERSGKIRYSECFQCLDCVTIFDDPKTCVPLVLATKKNKRTETMVQEGA